MSIITTSDPNITLTLEKTREHAVELHLVDNGTKMALRCEILSPRWNEIASFFQPQGILHSSPLDDAVYRYNGLTADQRELFKARIGNGSADPEVTPRASFSVPEDSGGLSGAGDDHV